MNADQKLLVDLRASEGDEWGFADLVGHSSPLARPARLLPSKDPERDTTASDAARRASFAADPLHSKSDSAKRAAAKAAAVARAKAGV